MHIHRNAKLGLAARRELALSVAAGASLREAARTFNVSVATAHRWSMRWTQASASERASLACLLDRSSRPHRSPRRLAPNLERAICACRRRTGWGPRLVAGATGFAHSTVWKVLRRFGLSRPRRPVREPANSYEWPCPGDLLHLDVSEYVRFKRPGHRVTGDRRSQDHVADGVPAADRQCLGVHEEPRLPRAPRPPRHPTPAHEALPAAHERQGRALPPDDGAGMGVWARIRLAPRSSTRPATLARPLQPRQAAQLARRPPPHQPRSQRLWVGQLEA
jgi:transposase